MEPERQEVFSRVECVARERFPEYTVVAESDPSDSGSIGVGVYGVPLAEVSAVRNIIYDLEEEIFPRGEYCLSAFVRDVEYTRQYCSQCMPEAKALSIDMDELCLQLSQKESSKWMDSTPINGVAALGRYASEKMDVSIVTDFLSSDCRDKWSPNESCPSSGVPVVENNFDRAA